jgi:hypothetical protein
VFVAIGRDEYLLPLTDAVFNEHISRKLGYGRNPAGLLADDREQRTIGQTESA